MIFTEISDKIIPARITEARISRGMTKVELSSHLGVAQQTITKYEKGTSGLSTEKINLLSKATKFPVKFFHLPKQTLNSTNSLGFFSSNRNLSEKVKEAFDVRIEWLHEFKSDFKIYIDFPEFDFTLKDDSIDPFNLNMTEIEEFALSVRQKMGLGMSPISDMIGVLENNGIIVGGISSDEFVEFNSLFAYSKWIDGEPFIIYNRDFPKGQLKMNFELAHELGHLLLHDGISDKELEHTNKKQEKEFIDLLDSQADRFAGSFLLPYNSLINEPFSSSIHSLIPISEKWNCSLETVKFRLAQTKLLSNNQIEYLGSQMIQNNFYHKPPNQPTNLIEAPSLIEHSLNLCIENNVLNKSDLISDSPLRNNDFMSLISLDEQFFIQSNKVIPLFRDH